MPLTADDLIKHLAAKGAGAITATAASPAPQKKGSVRVSSDTVQGVYNDELFAAAKTLGLDPSDDAVVAEAKKQTKHKIGDGNFANWQKTMDGEAEEARQESEEEKRQLASLPKIGNPYDSATKLVETMTNEATKMGKKMRFESWSASKLDAGTGVMGVINRTAGGTMGMASGVAHALDTATSAPVSLVTDTGANAISDMAHGKGTGSAVVSGSKQRIQELR